MVLLCSSVLTAQLLGMFGISHGELLSLRLQLRPQGLHLFPSRFFPLSKGVRAAGSGHLCSLQDFSQLSLLDLRICGRCPIQGDLRGPDELRLELSHMVLHFRNSLMKSMFTIFPLLPQNFQLLSGSQHVNFAGIFSTFGSFRIHGSRRDCHLCQGAVKVLSQGQHLLLSFRGLCSGLAIQGRLQLRLFFHQGKLSPQLLQLSLRQSELRMGFEALLLL
mmetsp:Transcript_91947/g.192267  ORF Transcript_91947/g.192267 Transcript_91947/m.192267 type:complete len:219 (-) Transcript_91947:1049-1705(-)